MNAAEFSQRLKIYRRLNGLSREAFAKRFGVPYGSVRNFESMRFEAPQYVMRWLVAEMKKPIAKPSK